MNPRTSETRYIDYNPDMASKATKREKLTGVFAALLILAAAGAEATRGLPSPFSAEIEPQLPALEEIAVEPAPASPFELLTAEDLSLLAAVTGAGTAGHAAVFARARFQLFEGLGPGPLERVANQKLASGGQHSQSWNNIRWISDLGVETWWREQSGQNLLFHGAWTDPLTGLAYHRNRWYDPRNASWLSEDPKGAVDSPNLYAGFAWGPHAFTDPLGLQGSTPTPTPAPLPEPIDQYHYRFWAEMTVTAPAPPDVELDEFGNPVTAPPIGQIYGVQQAIEAGEGFEQLREDAVSSLRQSGVSDVPELRLLLDEYGKSRGLDDQARLYLSLKILGPPSPEEMENPMLAQLEIYGQWAEGLEVVYTGLGILATEGALASGGPTGLGRSIYASRTFPVRLPSTAEGGLYYFGALGGRARSIHLLAGHPIRIKNTTVALAEVELADGSLATYAAASKAGLTRAQKEALEAQGIVWVRGKGHAEMNILDNLPEGAVVRRWGISRGVKQRPVPCPNCEPRVVAAGGVIEP